jgi:hypothetical protein
MSKGISQCKGNVRLGTERYINAVNKVAACLSHSVTMLY